MEYKKLGSAGVESFEAKARRSVVEFSLLRCREFVSSIHHVDVDLDTDHVWEHQWDQFLTDFYLICHENSKIQVCKNQICQILGEYFQLFVYNSRLLILITAHRLKSSIINVAKPWTTFWNCDQSPLWMDSWTFGSSNQDPPPEGGASAWTWSWRTSWTPWARVVVSKVDLLSRSTLKGHFWFTKPNLISGRVIFNNSLN